MDLSKINESNIYEYKQELNRVQIKLEKQEEEKRNAELYKQSVQLKKYAAEFSDILKTISTCSAANAEKILKNLPKSINVQKDVNPKDFASEGSAPKDFTPMDSARNLTNTLKMMQEITGTSTKSECHPFSIHFPKEKLPQELGQMSSTASSNEQLLEDCLNLYSSVKTIISEEQSRNCEETMCEEAIMCVDDKLKKDNSPRCSKKLLLETSTRSSDCSEDGLANCSIRTFSDTSVFASTYLGKNESDTDSPTLLK